MNLKAIIEDFEDYLAPKLDTYEQAIYLYVFRHSRVQGKPSAVIGFKSARRLIASGVGERGKPMAEGTCYEKLRSLEEKGCIRIVGTEHKGTRIELFLPSEIAGVTPQSKVATEIALEEMDFFEISENRQLILLRESGKCFYCFRLIDRSNFVIDHIAKRRTGGNTYTNVVAACRGCNNRKGELLADEYLRRLYREAVLSQEELTNRLQALEQLRSGALKPTIA